MYGLSPGTDLSPLLGCALTFVGFGQHQVQLAFAGQVQCSIVIEGEYVVTPPGREAVVFGDAVAGATSLLPFLGNTVTFASVPVDGTVRMSFDDGSTIEVLDSSTNYESYQVNLGDRLIIV